MKNLLSCNVLLSIVKLFEEPLFRVFWLDELIRKLILFLDLI